MPCPTLREPSTTHFSTPSVQALRGPGRCWRMSPFQGIDSNRFSPTPLTRAVARCSRTAFTEEGSVVHSLAPQQRSWSPSGLLRPGGAASILLVASFVLLTAAAPQAHAAVSCPNPNPVVDENQCHTGTSGWEVNDYSDNLGGVPTEHSAGLGEDMPLKIGYAGGTFPAVTANIAIYRMGYYGGVGARLVNSKTGVTINNGFQCNPMDTTTGKVDCGNWNVTY